MNKSFCYLLVGFLFFQNVNIISAARYSPHKPSTATFNNNHNKKKPKPFNKKNILYHVNKLMNFRISTLNQ